MDPLLSVLVLTYNQEKYIAQAIESILMQNTNFGFEILIGEDCSTDTTGNIVQSYAEKNPNKIRVISSALNVGAIRNEKILIENAKGKYICFLEGDDYWMNPLKLQKQVDFLEANPDYGLTHSDVDHYYENTGKTEQYVNRTNGIKVPEGYVFDALMAPQPFFIKTATVCFRKELVVKHFNYDLAIKENWPLTDFPLWLDITYHSKAHYFNEVFATYRLLNESASRMTSPAKKYNFHKGLYDIKKIYASKYNSKAIGAIEEEYYRGMIRIAFNMNDKNVMQHAFNFLKEKKCQIGATEKVMYLSSKSRLLYKLIKLVKS